MMKKQLSLKPAAVFALVLAVPLLAVTGAFGGEDDLVPRITEGRKAFVRICGSCHGVDRPEKKNMDRPAWDELITTMEGKGAKLTADERELVLDYLDIRNVFLTKCTTCHTTERILDKNRPFADWQETVTKMSQKMPGLLEEGELRSITAYLAALRGAQ